MFTMHLQGKPRGAAGLILGLLLSVLFTTNTALAADIITRDVGTAIIMRSTATIETVVEIIPEVTVSAERYRDLAAAIVNTSNGATAVIIARFTGNTPNTSEMDSRLQVAISLLNAQGMTYANQRIFLAGHGEGGFRAIDVVKRQRLGGLILLASYICQGSGSTLASYPAPVLTLGGELDNRTGMNFIARESMTLSSLEKTKTPDVIYDKPVVLLQGVNHMQFADGVALSGEFSPAIPTNLAHQRIARYILDLVTLHAVSIRKDYVAAQRSLNDAIQTTRTLTQPYTNVWNIEGRLATGLQQLAAPLQNGGWNSLSVVSKVYDNSSAYLAFMFDKSKVISTNTGPAVYVPLYYVAEADTCDIQSSHYVSAEYIAYKFRGQDAISLETGLPAGQAGLNCAEMNATVIYYTLNAINNPHQRNRISQRYGPIESWRYESTTTALENIVHYGPFVITSTRQTTGIAWLGQAAGLKRSGIGTTWEITSAELFTSADTQPKSFAGANYMKIISPLRIVEWATIFGLEQ